MQQAVKDYIDSTFRIFDQYEVTDPSILAEIEALRGKYVRLAERTGDIMGFVSAAPGEGLYEEFTKLTTKIVMRKNQAAAAEQKEAPKIPTVSEYVEQYRSGFDEVKKHPERRRAIQAYERLFDLKNRTDDLLTAEILMEREHLLWDLTYYNALDVEEARLKDMDPLFRSTTAAILNAIAAVRESGSAEEYYYNAAVHEVKSLYDRQEYQARMLAAVNLALRLIEFCSLKRDFYTHRDNALRKGFLKGLIAKRQEIRKILAFSEYALHMTFEDLMEDEGVKIWLLSPQIADDGAALGRVRTAMHPQNYEVFREMIEEEIRPEISVAEILKRRPKKVLWYRP
ncbi:MAG: hypothetical protein IK088_08155 [Lachnospiraceae bacterium]|nr:hypothetical protein [Lachnospiraceae bacterium]